MSEWVNRGEQRKRRNPPPFSQSDIITHVRDNPHIVNGMFRESFLNRISGWGIINHKFRPFIQVSSSSFLFIPCCCLPLWPRWKFHRKLNLRGQLNAHYLPVLCVQWNSGNVPATYQISVPSQMSRKVGTCVLMAWLDLRLSVEKATYSEMCHVSGYCSFPSTSTLLLFHPKRSLRVTTSQLVGKILKIFSLVVN